MEIVECYSRCVPLLPFEIGEVIHRQEHADSAEKGFR